MKQRRGLWYKVLLVVLALTLLIPILAACGDDDDETPAVTTTPSATSTASTQPTLSTTTKTSEGPVKLGVVTSWSGTAGMVGTAFVGPLLGLIEDQVEEMGGILGGRSIEFIKYDDESSVARTVSGVTRFADDDSVSLVLFGGSSGASIVAGAQEAERLHMPLFTLYTSYPEDMKTHYTIGIHAHYSQSYGGIMELAYETEPKTIAFFGMDDQSTRINKPRCVEEAESRGIEVVYDELWDPGTTDFSPYLTKIKYADPDVLILMPVRPEGALAIYKQVGDLGGWGDIRVLSPHSATASASNLPTSEGTIVWMTWVEGVQTPGAQAFEQAWTKKYGRPPFHDGQAHMYTCIWTAIRAIELAGSADREEILKAARSGNLTWESPAGPLTINALGDGMGYFTGYFVQIHDGKKIILK